MTQAVNPYWFFFVIYWHGMCKYQQQLVELFSIHENFNIRLIDVLKQ